MTFMSNHSYLVAASLRGVCGLPSLPDYPMPTLCSESALPFSERHTSCSVSFDTSGKELWHRVISSGHSPSADVRKQSHSCRWDLVLCNSIRGAAYQPADWLHVWFIYVYVIWQKGAVWVTISVRNMHCFFWAEWQYFSCLALWDYGTTYQHPL